MIGLIDCKGCEGCEYRVYESFDESGCYSPGYYCEADHCVRTEEDGCEEVSE